MYPDSIGTALVWAAFFVVPAALGYLVAKIRSHKARLLLLGSLAVLPVAILTAGMALLPPSAPSYLAWWMAGMLMLSPGLVVWAGSSLAGYAEGRRSGR
jgi:hypothetical protein